MRAMLASGQRPVRVEPSTLIVWGIATGGLCAALEEVVPRLAGSDVTRMAAVTAGIILGVGMLAAWIDRRCLARHRADRGETIHFVEIQIAKAWALLFVLGVALTVGTFFFGGQYMVYAFWLVLLGVGMFLHALFSEQLPAWAGIAFILLGIGPLAAHASYAEMRWIAASTLGIGLPVLGWIVAGAPGMPARWASLWQPILWTSLVLSVAAVAASGVPLPTDAEVPVVELADLGSVAGMRGPLAVRVRKGTRIALRLWVSGETFVSDPGAEVALTSAKDFEILVVDGNATQWTRAPGERWERGVTSFRRMHFEPALEGHGAFLKAEVETTRLRLR